MSAEATAAQQIFSISKGTKVCFTITVILSIAYYLLISEETEFLNERWALLVLIAVLCLGPAMAVLHGRYYSYAMAVIGPITHVVYPKLAILLGNDEQNLIGPYSALGIYAIAGCLLLTGIIYFSMGYLFKEVREGRRFGEKAGLRIEVRSSIWIGTLFAYLGTFFVDASVVNALKNLFPIILLCTEPVGMKQTSRFIAYPLLPISFLDFIFTGFLHPFFLFSGILLTLSLIEKRFLVGFLAAIAVLFGSYVNQFKPQYRKFITRIDPPTFEDRVTYIKLGISLAVLQNLDDEALEGGDLGTLFSGNLTQEGFLARSNDDTLERALELTPSVVPYWMGETYEHLFYVLIPRFLWHTKPEWVAGNKFGIAYRFIETEDGITAVLFNPYTEAYMNFGWVGLCLLSFVFAFLFYFCDIIAVRSFGPKSIIAPLAYTAIFSQFQTHFAGVLYNVIVISGALYILAKVFERISVNKHFGVKDVYLE